MVARFVFPKDEIVAWARCAWRDVTVPFAYRSRGKAQQLWRRLGACSLRAIVPIAFAVAAIVTTTQGMSPASTELRAPAIDIREFVRASRRSAHAGNYAWLTAAQRGAYEPLADRIAPPPGFQRVVMPAGTFGHWLRHLPVCDASAHVRDYRGRKVQATSASDVAAVVALQPNTTALGSAGMMVRLRAEHAWSTATLGGVSFHFNSGQRLSWSAWSRGVRALQGDEGTRFEMTDIADDSRESFCAWMETQLQFTSCASLLDDTRAIDDETIAPGDLLVRTGRDAHVLIVLDVAVTERGRVAVLLGSGATPAATFHVLRAPRADGWFVLSGTTIDTGAKGPFDLSQLRRWAM